MADALWALGKLAEGVDDLVSGAGGIKARLYEVATRRVVTIQPREIPEELRGDLVKIKADLTGGTDIEATIREMSDDDAGVIARRVFELFMKLDRMLNPLRTETD
jgi:hypothetical protein